MEEKALAKVSDVMTEPMEYGKVFAESGIFPDVKSAAQGAIKVLAGKEVGLSPLQSLNAFYFVNGRLAMVVQAMAALIKKSGKYDYQIEEQTAEGCTISFYLLGGGKKELIGKSTFDKIKAAKAGIINKDNYKNYPENMYFARSLANGARWYCPDAISGFYTVEELQDLEPSVSKEKTITIDAEGEVKEDAGNQA
jgi:hypothetical protein